MSRPQIIDGNPLVLFLVQTVGESGRGRLIDDPQDI